MANWPLAGATEPRAPTPAPLPPPAQGLSPNLGSFFPGRKTVLWLKARALTSCCRESSARSQPQPGGWEGCSAPARTAGTCWLFTKWHLGLWKIQFHSSVPGPGKINKTFISFGDFAKVNGEFNMNFQVSLAAAGCKTSHISHCNGRNAAQSQRSKPGFEHLGRCPCHLFGSTSQPAIKTSQ